MSRFSHPSPFQQADAIHAAGRASQGIGPAGNPAGTAQDRSTTTPDGNLTGREPSNQELPKDAPKDVPTSEEPGAIAPDSRPMRDHGLLDGTRQGPAQPQ